MARWWCDDGVMMVCWWCEGGARMVWCEGGARMVRGWCEDGQLMRVNECFILSPLLVSRIDLISINSIGLVCLALRQKHYFHLNINPHYKVH